MNKQLSFSANTANAPAKTEFLHKANYPPADIRSGNLLTGRVSQFCTFVENINDQQ